MKSRDALAEEYGYSGRNAACYLRINNLIRLFKALIDDNKIALLMVVDISYLSEEEQEMVYKVIGAMGVKLKPKIAEELRKHGGELTEDMVGKLIGSMIVKKNEDVSIRLPTGVRRKYFADMNAAQMTEVVEQVLEAWFSGKEVGDVQQ